jgi:hypothetical protein
VAVAGLLTQRRLATVVQAERPVAVAVVVARPSRQPAHTATAVTAHAAKYGSSPMQNIRGVQHG